MELVVFEPGKAGRQVSSQDLDAAERSSSEPKRYPGSDDTQDHLLGLPQTSIQIFPSFKITSNDPGSTDEQLMDFRGEVILMATDWLFGSHVVRAN